MCDKSQSQSQSPKNAAPSGGMIRSGGGSGAGSDWGITTVPKDGEPVGAVEFPNRSHGGLVRWEGIF